MTARQEGVLLPRPLRRPIAVQWSAITGAQQSCSRTMLPHAGSRAPADGSWRCVGASSIPLLSAVQRDMADARRLERRDDSPRTTQRKIVRALSACLCGRSRRANGPVHPFIVLILAGIGRSTENTSSTAIAAQDSIWPCGAQSPFFIAAVAVTASASGGPLHAGLWEEGQDRPRRIRPHLHLRARARQSRRRWLVAPRSSRQKR